MTLKQYQLKSEQAQQHLEEAHKLLDELLTQLEADYPPDKRSYQMGKVMESIAGANNQAAAAAITMQDIQWPLT